MKNRTTLPRAAVLGDPISHSLSPVIHNFFLQKYKIQGSYEAIRVKKDEFHSVVTKLVSDGFAGFNVTLPHKEEMFKICDFKSKSAGLTKAVNTVVVTSDKRLFGHNSDVDGFLNNLKETNPPFDLNGKICHVIGAGGAARAVIYGLLKSGVKKIIITNRNENRALELVDDFSKMDCRIMFLHQKPFEESLTESDLLVNCTSLGMLGQESLTLDIAGLKKSALVCDIVYKPLITDLLKRAQIHGNSVVTGIGMLVHQALIGFECWFNEKPENDNNLVKILIEKSCLTY